MKILIRQAEDTMLSTGIWALTSLIHPQASIMQTSAESVAPTTFTFSQDWSVLGPWQIGTRGMHQLPT